MAPEFVRPKALPASRRPWRSIALWLAGNALLIGLYCWDAATIQCEPCAPHASCPPCETPLMANIRVYLPAWNLGFPILVMAWRRLSRPAH